MRNPYRLTEDKGKPVYMGPRLTMLFALPVGDKVVLFHNPVPGSYCCLLYERQVDVIKSFVQFGEV